MSSKDLQSLINEALDNIRNDRKITRELLDDAVKWLSKDEARHREVGLTASKYVETLQRSNEQLVKIAALMQKKQGKEVGLSEQDKNQILDLMQENGDG